jgi:hypothetical protein
MTDKQKEEWRMNVIMLLSSAKLLSDQSTYLQGELHHELKVDYNNMVRATDRFIKTVEKIIGDEASRPLQEIAEHLNEEMVSIRKKLTELV